MSQFGWAAFQGLRVHMCWWPASAEHRCLTTHMWGWQHPLKPWVFSQPDLSLHGVRCPCPPIREDMSPRLLWLEENQKQSHHRPKGCGARWGQTSGPAPRLMISETWGESLNLSRCPCPRKWRGALLQESSFNNPNLILLFLHKAWQDSRLTSPNMELNGGSCCWLLPRNV